MKQHIYCRSGLSSTRLLNRIASRTTKRNQYSVEEKIRILRVVQNMVDENRITYAEAASAVTVDQSMISRWRKQEGAWGSVKRPEMLRVADGPRAILSSIEVDLLEFIDTWRNKGLPVNRVALMRKARTLMPHLESKSESALKMSISRFMNKHRLVHRMATHKAQRHPSEVEGEALQFLAYIRPVLIESNRDPNFMYNMDQTPVQMAMDWKVTINKVGARTVNLRTSASETKRLTVAVTLTASGRRVKSMVVFKGEYEVSYWHSSYVDSPDCFFVSSFPGTPDGHIAKRELPSLPKDLVYACQKKAWFDEAIMMKWIDEVLAPDVATAPPGIVPILFLDSFSVHLKGSVVQKIQALGVQVEIIPPGCTGLLQPVDVGFNKAFKAKLRTEYNGWLLDQDPDLPIPGTTRRDVSDWIIAAEKNVTDETLKNAWRKTGYSYFGVFLPDGEFDGDNAMIGDDPDDERDPEEHDSDEGELASYTNAELGLPDSSSSDDTDDDAAGDDNEGPMV